MVVVLETILAILDSCGSSSPLFPPTDLYNETWLLRLVVDWFSRHEVPGHFLAMPDGGKWFSEAWLPSAFLPRYKGDKLAESWTHADAVIGHFTIGAKGRADLQLREDAAHLVVLEAKMFSALSSGVTHAPYYDQAARNVACIAEVLRVAKRTPSDLSRFGFYLLAPQSQIEGGVFTEELRRESIRQKVKRRVDEYSGDREQWYSDWFQPAIEQIDIDAVDWERLIATIREYEPEYAESIEDFYRRCRDFNR